MNSHRDSSGVGVAAGRAWRRMHTHRRCCLGASRVDVPSAASPSIISISAVYMDPSGPVARICALGGLNVTASMLRSLASIRYRRDIIATPQNSASGSVSGRTTSEFFVLANECTNFFRASYAAFPMTPLLNEVRANSMVSGTQFPLPFTMRGVSRYSPFSGIDWPNPKVSSPASRRRSATRIFEDWLGGMTIRHFRSCVADSFDRPLG